MSKLWLSRENHPCPVGLAGSSGIPEGRRGTERKLSPYLDPEFRRYLARHWLLFAFSAGVGSVSHILWDRLFTPRGPVFHLASSFFSQEVTVAGHPFLMYILIDRIESAVALLVIG